MPEITAFITTIGEPSYEKALQSLKDQKSVDFDIVEIKFMAPWDEVLNYMFDNCKTKYLAQVDEDVELQPRALKCLYDTAERDENIVCIETKLADLNGEMRRGGLKLFRSSAIKGYRCRPRHKTNREFMRRLLKENPKYKYITLHDEHLGTHGKTSSPQLLFVQSEKCVRGWDCFGNPAKRIFGINHVEKMLRLYRENPNIQNQFAVMGAVFGLAARGGKPALEKNYANYNTPELEILTQIYELPRPEWQILRKPRIAFVHTSMYIGGLETLFLNLASRLGEDFDFHFIIYNPRRYTGPDRDFGPLFKEFKHRFYCETKEELKNYIYNSGIDLVQAHGDRDVVDVAIRLGIPVIERVNGRTCMRSTKEGILKVIVAGAPTRDLEKMIQREKMLRHVFNGVDLKKMDETKAKRLFLEDDVVIGTVSRIGDSKNLPLLLEAAKILVKKRPNVKFAIIGGESQPNNPHIPELKKLAEEYKDSIYFSNEFVLDPFKYIKGFDIAVSTSTVEGVPNFIFEAMAASKPIISSDVGDIRQSLKRAEGIELFPSENLDQLISKLNKLISNPTLRVHYGEENRKLVDDKFSLHRVARIYRGLYKTILRNRELTFDQP